MNQFMPKDINNLIDDYVDELHPKNISLDELTHGHSKKGTKKNSLLKIEDEFLKDFKENKNIENKLLFESV